MISQAHSRLDTNLGSIKTSDRPKLASKAQCFTKESVMESNRLAQENTRISRTSNRRNMARRKISRRIRISLRSTNYVNFSQTRLLLVQFNLIRLNPMKRSI